MGWAEPEFGTLELGDARRTRRLIRLVDDPFGAADGKHPTGQWGLGGDQSGPTGCWTTTHWTGGRFRRSIPSEQWSGCRDIGSSCVIQDTTELDFTSQPGIAGLATELRGSTGCTCIRPWR
ncbi:MAG: hypothetical protein IPL99_26255 [Candidatus Competibacteraceae bacterium]|nr:hypothetical protein [Candidatus Competibacteraceae bacterium]